SRLQLMLCLISQRLLLLAYNEKLGADFSRVCVRKFREVYLELLDQVKEKTEQSSEEKEQSEEEG
ncbi:unnamed protein product, partial [Durusdinium trenchii]